jgi:hypothetical protein
VTVCRTLAEIEAAAFADAAGDPVPTQAQANLAHALISPHLPRMSRAQAAPHAPEAPSPPRRAAPVTQR